MAGGHRMLFIITSGIFKIKIKKAITLIFTGRATGMERIWVIGDDFAAASFQQYFITSANDSYTKENFEASGFFANALSHNRSPISRIRNALTCAYNQQLLIPKMVFIVTEDDIIKDLEKLKSIMEKREAAEKILNRSNSNNYEEISDEESPPEPVDYRDLYRRVMTHLFRAVATTTKRFKQAVPYKAKKEIQWPKIIWISPTSHHNYGNSKLRNIMSEVMDDCARIHENMSVEKLKQIWDPQDRNLFLKDQQRITGEGFCSFWNAFDRTVKYCDNKYFIGPSKRAERNDDYANRRGCTNYNQGNNRYVWQNANYKRNNDERRRKLPTPPRRR